MIVNMRYETCFLQSFCQEVGGGPIGNILTCFRNNNLKVRGITGSHVDFFGWDAAIFCCWTIRSQNYFFWFTSQVDKFRYVRDPENQHFFIDWKINQNLDFLIQFKMMLKNNLYGALYFLLNGWLFHINESGNYCRGETLSIH